MVLKLLLLVLVIACDNRSLAAGSNSTQADKSLVLLHVIFRHGDRNPQERMGPNDPYVGPDYWPEGYYNLNNMGKMRMFKLGQFLKERYGAFLGEYSDEKVWVRSTDKSRTLMSAECVVAGLYPPTEDQVWNQNLSNWQPIPVHTVPVPEDRLLNEIGCPTYAAAMQAYENSPSIAKMKQDDAEKLADLGRHLGKNITTLKDMMNFADGISVLLQSNLTLPDWINEFYPDWVEHYHTLGRAPLHNNDVVKRIQAGPLLEEWRSNFRKFQNLAQDELNFFLYAAHDYNLMVVLNSLDIFYDEQSPYGTVIMVEMHQEPSRGFFVKTYFRRGNETETKLLTPKSCDQECPLEQFISIMNKTIPKDWNLECYGAVPSGPGMVNVGYLTILVIVILYSAVMTILIIVFVWIRPTRRKGYNPL